jgi:hypothetical protein
MRDVARDGTTAPLDPSPGIAHEVRNRERLRPITAAMEQPPHLPDEDPRPPAASAGDRPQSPSPQLQLVVARRGAFERRVKIVFVLSLVAMACTYLA